MPEVTLPPTAVDPHQLDGDRIRRAGRRRRALRWLFLAAWVGVLLLGAEVAVRLLARANPGLIRDDLPHYARVAQRHVEGLAPEQAKIFFFGGSTMAGFPYDPMLSPTTWIDLLRGWWESDRPVALVNFGKPGAGTPYVLRAVSHALQYEPDLVVLLIGHNEFLWTERSEGWLDALVRGSRHSALVRLAESAGRSAQDKIRFGLFARRVSRGNTAPQVVAEDPALDTGDGSGDGELLRPFFTEVTEPRRISGSPEMRDRIAATKARLELILQACRDRGVAVLLATPPYNARFPPYGNLFSATGADLARWKEHVRRGLVAMRDGTLETARDEFRNAESIDDTNAMLAYRLAECYDGLGDLAAARNYFHKAGELDLRRAHVFGEVERLIAGVAAEQGVPYLNLYEEFARLDESGIVDGTYIVDNVHPNLEGQYLLARALLGFISRESGLLRLRPGADPPPFEELLEGLSVDPEFIYATYRQLGDYYIDHFDEALDHYRRAFDVLPTREICIRILELCRRHERYQDTGPWLERLSSLPRDGLLQERVPG